MMFLVAGAIFSLIHGEFIEMIENYNELNMGLDDEESLYQFFDLMKHFNKNVEMNEQLKAKFEDYFEFRWRKNRNAAIESENELKLLEQLPEDVQNTLIMNSLHRKFMSNFRPHFRLPKLDPRGDFMTADVFTKDGKKIK